MNALFGAALSVGAFITLHYNRTGPKVNPQLARRSRPGYSHGPMRRDRAATKTNQNLSSFRKICREQGQRGMGLYI